MKDAIGYFAVIIAGMTLFIVGFFFGLDIGSNAQSSTHITAIEKSKANQKTRVLTINETEKQILFVCDGVTR